MAYDQHEALPLEEAIKDFESLCNLLGACAADSMEVAGRRNDAFGKQAAERVEKVRALLRNDDILYSPRSPLRVILAHAHAAKEAQAIHDAMFLPTGAMNPSAQGTKVMLEVTIGYPGSLISDLNIGGERIQLPNEAIRTALNGNT